MTRRLLSSLAAASIFLGPGCEKHPASQTVPGFNDKQVKAHAAQDREARTPLTINPDAPKFFPQKNER